MILKGLLLTLIALFTFHAPVSNVVPQQQDAIVETIENQPVLHTSARLAYEINRLDATANDGMVNDLWSGFTTTIDKVIDFMVSLFEGVVKIFWNSEGTTTNKLTIVGWLTLLGLAFGAFYTGLRFIRGMISRMRGR